MADIITLSLDEAQRLAREIVDEYGAEHVYAKIPDENGHPTCRYVELGAPTCIVGHILLRAGVPLADLEDNNERSVDNDTFLMDVGVDVDTRTEDFLTVLQEAQDTGSGWGVALQSAIAGSAFYDED